MSNRIKIMIAVGGILLILGLVWISTAKPLYAEWELMTMAISKEQSIRASVAAQHTRGVITSAVGGFVLLGAFLLHMNQKS